MFLLKFLAWLGLIPKIHVLPFSGQKAGADFAIPLDKNTELKFRWIPAGSFQKRPLYEYAPAQFTPVRFSMGFWLSETPITQGQWNAVLKAAPPQNADWPVAPTRIDEVSLFLNALTKIFRGKGLLTDQQLADLPSALEWEYACRAGTTTRHYWGDDAEGLAENAFFLDNSNGELHPVGKKKANAWGLFDMIGLVSEWRYENQPPQPGVSLTDPQPIKPPHTSDKRFYSVTVSHYQSPPMACVPENEYFCEYANPENEPIGFRVIIRK